MLIVCNTLHVIYVRVSWEPTELYRAHCTHVIALRPSGTHDSDVGQTSIPIVWHVSKRAPLNIAVAVVIPQSSRQNPLSSVALTWRNHKINAHFSLYAHAHASEGLRLFLFRISCERRHDDQYNKLRHIRDVNLNLIQFVYFILRIRVFVVK